MDPRTLLLVVAALACPIAMGLMMWMMNRNMSDDRQGAMRGDQRPTSAAERLAELRAERELLEAEIAEVTRIAELEARREALAGSQPATSKDAPTIVSR